jgi:hypothetical protein
MDNDDEHYLIVVRWDNDSQSQPETFHGCTNVETDQDEITFHDQNGKHHQLYGVAYHITEE